MGLPPSLRNEWRLKYQQLEEKLKQSKEDGPSHGGALKLVEFVDTSASQVLLLHVACWGMLEKCAASGSGYQLRFPETAAKVHQFISIHQYLISHHHNPIMRHFHPTIHRFPSHHPLSIVGVSKRPEKKRRNTSRSHRTVRCGP